MQTKKRNILKKLIVCAILAATGFILDRYLGIMLPLFGVKSLSINMSFVPIFLAGFLYGPVFGALVGAVQDLLGAFLVPLGPYFWGYTLTTALVGAMAGLFGKLFLRKEIFENQPAKPTEAKSFAVRKIICCFGLALPILFLVFPMVSFTFADNTTYSLTLGAAAISTSDTKNAFISLLSLFNTSAEQLSYTATRISSVTTWLCVGVVVSVICGIIGAYRIITKAQSGSVVFPLISVISSGIVAATQLIYVPKALAGLDVTVSFGLYPYVAPILFAVALLVALSLSDGLKFKLSVFCVIASASASALNSLWLTMTVNPMKAYTIYLLPRLASALFISAPLYAILCRLLIQRVVPKINIK